MHGWYSKKQSQFGHCLYTTFDGKIVKITEMTKEKKVHGKWDDYEYVGLVDKCIEPNKYWRELEDESPAAMMLVLKKLASPPKSDNPKDWN